MLIEAISKSSFFLLRDKIEKALARSILSLGEKTKLRDACEYALLGGGKRVRSILVMMVAEALGNGLDVTSAALAVEFFHAASLIVDDLPPMDNGDERREKPSVHKAYGEATALLASYSLVFAGYSKICENGEFLKSQEPPFSSFADQICCLAVSEGSRLAGILGATSGQFLDLYPPSQGAEVMREIIYKKTATLFEISCILGWLFGGGELTKLERVRQAGVHLGFAFQIADDFIDFKQDEKNKEEINAVKILGKERCFDLFHKELEAFKTALSDLEIYTPAFQKMAEMLVKQIK